MQKAVAAREAKKKKTEEERKKADLASSGGLKKGFFSSGKAATKKAAAVSSRAEQSTSPAEEVPYITGSADPMQNLKLPEVQAAIKQNTEALKKDQSWVTPDLMKAMQSKPHLLAGLANPAVQEAIALMQKDPEAAQKKYANNKEVSEFLMEFSSLMATHFDLMSKNAPEAPAKKASAPSAGSTTKPVAALMPSGGGGGTTESLGGGYPGGSRQPVPLHTGNLPVDDPVTKALSDPRVAEAFQDAEVQKLLAELRAGRPLEMRELCRERPQLFMKIKVLLDAGLLNLQQ